MTKIALTVPGGIHACFASRTACVLVLLKGSGRSSDTSGAFVLRLRLWKEARMAAGPECHKSPFRLLGKIPQM